METTELTPEELKARMRATGVTVRKLARQAGMCETHLSAALRGREYLGANRRARLTAAVIELGLDKEPERPRLRITFP